MRLNRFLARGGIASRRRSDDLIAAGAVRVNGEVASATGCLVDPAQDRVECDGHRVCLPADFEYVLLNKPPGTVVTSRDTHGRTTVYDGLRGIRPATVAVGRLDRDTTGVLLFTDDGELAHRLAHPRYGAEKRYEAVVLGRPSDANLERLRRGVDLEDGPTAPAKVRILTRRADDGAGRARLEICLHEGRKHQVKRMCRAVGHQVKALARVEFAGLRTNGLRQGAYRQLQPQEVCDLLALVDLRR